MPIVALKISASCPLLTCHHEQVFKLKDGLINHRQLSIMLGVIQCNRSAATDNETSLIPCSKITSQTQVLSIQKGTVNPYQIFSLLSMPKEVNSASFCCRMCEWPYAAPISFLPNNRFSGSF